MITDVKTGIAGILSLLVPGLGQIYKSQNIKGVIILAIYLFCFNGIFASHDPGFWAGVSIVIALIAAIDALKF